MPVVKISKNLRWVAEGDWESQNALYEMANLSPKRTGLPLYIWASEKKASHGPRIKVSVTPGKMDQLQCVLITVEDEPKIIGRPELAKQISADDFRKIKAFIKLNREALEGYWFRRIQDTGDFVDMLKPI